MDAKWGHGDHDGEPLRLPEFRRNLAEAEAALLLVQEGTAYTVTLSGLRHLSSVAARILPAAQQAGIELSIDRSGSGVAYLMIGPRSAALVAVPPDAPTPPQNTWRRGWRPLRRRSVSDPDG